MDDDEEATRAPTVCPCGKTGRSDNIRRHMRTCKKLRAAKKQNLDLSAASIANLTTALVVKDGELATARARISQLEAQLKAPNITIINNFTTINTFKTMLANSTDDGIARYHALLCANEGQPCYGQ